MVQPTDSTQSPSTNPYTNPYTLPPVTTPPPNTSVLGKHGRKSETSSETGYKGKDGGAAYSQAFGLRTDFDAPKQVSLSVCAQQITRSHNPCTQMAEHTNGRAYWARTITPLTHTSSNRTYVQLCHKRRYCTNHSLQPYNSIYL